MGIETIGPLGWEECFHEPKKDETEAKRLQDANPGSGVYWPPGSTAASPTKSGRCRRRWSDISSESSVTISSASRYRNTIGTSAERSRR